MFRSLRKTDGELKDRTAKLDIFARYYQDLYSSMEVEVRSIDEFLDKIKLPILEAELLEALEAPIAMEEIRLAVNA